MQLVLQLHVRDRRSSLRPYSLVFTRCYCEFHLTWNVPPLLENDKHENNDISRKICAMHIHHDLPQDKDLAAKKWEQNLAPSCSYYRPQMHIRRVSFRLATPIEPSNLDLIVSMRVSKSSVKSNIVYYTMIYITISVLVQSCNGIYELAARSS